MKHEPGKRYYNSEVVFGMVERGGRVRVKHVKSSGKRVLIPEIKTAYRLEAPFTVMTGLHTASFRCTGIPMLL